MDPQLYQRFYEIEDTFWWSVGTRRIFFRVLQDVRSEGGGQVLDVGCGTGVMLQELVPEWRLAAGCDGSDLALSFCRRRGLRHLVQCDATSLPFRSGGLDLVTALDVIEHLDDDETCLREIARVCRPGGHVLLHVPAFRILWTEKDELNHHRRRYGRAELIGLVERCGLDVRRIFYVNSFVFPAALLNALWHRVRRPGPTTAAASVEQI
jgi:ubiquinone/menaquinone biosynthesis C-methylase UbiE